MAQGNADPMEAFFSGDKLYGDDFTPAEIARWFEEEAEGYARLGSENRSRYRYEYHGLNWMLGYRHLPATPIPKALGFGSAYGDELLPLAGRIGSITIVDPSDAFQGSKVGGVPTTYVKPSPDGLLPFRYGEFDLITCFGVLHHIPNVSAVVSELSRVLAPGGNLLIREPIVSMGDWRRPRAGLTANERGIPLRYLRETVNAAGLRVQRESLCGFPITERAFAMLKRDVWNNRFFVAADSIVAQLFAWNIKYHRRTFIDRFRPTSAFLICRK